MVFQKGGPRRFWKISI